MDEERQAKARGIAGGLAVAVLPVLCCGLPLLIASGVSIALAATLGGAVVGAVVLGAAIVLLVLRYRRRRADACRVQDAHRGASRTPSRWPRVDSHQ